MQLLARPNNPNLICFRLPQPERALAKAVAGKTTPLKIAAVRLSLIPFPLSTDTCGLLSLSRTLSRLSPWQRQSCELRICLIRPRGRRQSRTTHTQTFYMHTYTRTHYRYAFTLQICIHHPMTPIPRLRLLRTPSVTGRGL